MVILRSNALKCSFYFVMGAYGYIGSWIPDQKVWGSDLAPGCLRVIVLVRLCIPHRLGPPSRNRY